MTSNTVLRRLLRAGDADIREKPGRMSAHRVLRISMARAADTSVGLALTVLGVAEEGGTLDEAVAVAPGDGLFLALTRAGETVGYAAIDGETRSALVEIQTLGQLRAARDAARPFTAGDVELCRPLLEAVLREVRCLADDTPLEGWTNGASTGPRLSGPRAVTLGLPEGRYRTVRLTLDFGLADREGTLVLSLPATRKRTDPEPAPPPRSEEFGRQFRACVLEAPARLHAVLHRMEMPLSDVEGFEVGQVLPLSGVTVSSVRLEGPGEEIVVSARLGQIAGLRALRLERPGRADLSDIPMAEKTPATVAAPGTAAGLPDTGGAPDPPAPDASA